MKSTIAAALGVIMVIASHAEARHVRHTQHASNEAAAIGHAAGSGCNGRASFEKTPGDWIVLCSNGKSYEVRTSGAQAGSPAIECSIAHTQDGANCF